MKKILFNLFILICLTAQSYAATQGSATTSANVGQLINIELASASGLGDIRTSDYNNFHIITITIDNNDDDGYTLNFQSDNGSTFSEGDNYGYLIHVSAEENTTGNISEGQKPSTRYELLMGENGNTTEYGHTSSPSQLVSDCTSPAEGASKFQIIDGAGTNVVFNDVNRATRQGYFNLCMTQASDIQLFHGDFKDTIIVSISDN